MSIASIAMGTTMAAVSLPGLIPDDGAAVGLGAEELVITAVDVAVDVNIGL